MNRIIAVVGLLANLLIVSSCTRRSEGQLVIDIRSTSAGDIATARRYGERVILSCQGTIEFAANQDNQWAALWCTGHQAHILVDRTGGYEMVYVFDHRKPK